MKISKSQKLSLTLAGVAALAVGLFILAEPFAFYKSYAILLPNNPNLLSELRAPGANLAALGIVILAGLFYPSLTKTSAIIAITVFTAFPVGRLVSIALDGFPSEEILVALIIEVVITITLIIAFAKRPERLSHKLS